MTQKLFRLGIVLSIITISFFLSNCNKPDDLGLDVVKRPGDDLNVHYVDTFSLISYSNVEDSLKTSVISTYVIGQYYDNIFGTTTGQLYTQIRLPESDIDFGANAVCDSIVLSLRLGGFYGDSTESQTFKVFEVTDLLSTDSTYYHFSKPDIDNQEIGTVTIDGFNTTDSVNVDGEMRAAQIRIPLTKDFGEKIISKSGMTELSDNDNFMKFIRGINIQASGSVSKGGLAYIDLINTATEIKMYYKNDLGPNTMSMIVNTFCSSHAVFEHPNNYADASTAFKQQVTSNDTSLGQQIVYLQPLGGVETIIKMPHLSDLQSENNAALASAEIIFKVEGSTDANSEVPAQLALVNTNKSGKVFFLADNLEGTSYFDGKYDESSRSYRFRVTRHIQKILTGEIENYGMKLVVNGSAVQGNRVVLAGPDASTRAMKLKLIYTDVD